MGWDYPRAFFTRQSAKEPTTGQVRFLLMVHSLTPPQYNRLSPGFPWWLHIYLVPAALLGTRALHQNARACPGAGPHALTIIRIKKPGLNRLYCGGVSECTMSKNLTWPAFNATRGHLPYCRTLATLTIPTGHSVTPAGRGGCPPSGTACPVIKSAI